MADKLENIFDECLERMLRGESLESCLWSHPEVASELEPLLRTAFDIDRRASQVQARPEFKRWARVRVEGAYIYASEQKQQTRGGWSFSLQRSWAFAAIAIFLVLFSSVGTAAASSNALPDEPLYPVKLATEQVRVTMAFSEEDKVKVHTQLAEKRASEIATMASQGKTQEAAVAVENLTQHLDKANYAITRVERTATATAPLLPTTTTPMPPPPAGSTATQTPPSTLPEKTAKPESSVPGTTPKPSTSPGATTASSGTARYDAERVEKLKKLVEAGGVKNIAVLENALQNAPEQAKPTLERAINNVKNQTHRGTGTGSKGGSGTVPAWQAPTQGKPDSKDNSGQRSPDSKPPSGQSGTGGQSTPGTVNPTPTQPSPGRTDGKSTTSPGATNVNDKSAPSSATPSPTVPPSKPAGDGKGGTSSGGSGSGTK